mgnify:CR=1 FL=1
MREIKFRAWHRHSNKMYALSGFERIDDKVMTLNYLNDNENYCSSTVLVENIELMQYTGLKDKNGVEIYEGDILHLYGTDTMNKYDWKAVVEFGNPNGFYWWGFQLKPIVEFKYNTDILCWVGMEEANVYCEVIGNIHERGEKE